MFNPNNWSLDQFRVVITGRQAVTTASVRIYTKKIVFNQTAAAEMRYPENVRILISDEADKMVVLPYYENDMTAIPFYQKVYSETEDRYVEPRAITIPDKTFAKGIREKREWADAKPRICNAMRFTEMPDGLFFDLSTARIPTKSNRNGSAADSFKTYPPLNLLMQSMQPVIFSLPPASVV